MTATIKVMLIENDERKVQALRQALDSSEYSIEHVTHTGISLLHEVVRVEPDLIIMNIEFPNRDVLDSLHLMSQSNPKPVVMFSEQEDSDTIQNMMKCGVSAYVVGDSNPKRVKTILDTAVARFSEYQQLKEELQQTKQRLSSQKVVEQAKGWLMETKKLSEKEAYHSIRKMAMNNSQKIEDVAKNILSLASVLEKD
ncbi:ANTAR domain-containing response regulator [Vibrio methylphosphonaticus]|uniref:ANTAR domain-containing response regulator n=1 Tax=Vibrio methylphosphonaticus TaxID=2946866 RepID=UPI002029CE26|nr:ANTAR domain-containing protein [Vibrio methylphosphonaticus]MCL9777198.1 ANTAR domain-containing protein [Vibrio methylphosphonaticus]